MTLRELVGSGDKIIGYTLPVLIVAVVLSAVYPSVFGVGPSETLRVISIVALVAGVMIWIWSVVLIMTSARRGELITTGPFRLLKHPIYTAVSLLVLPSIGLLLDTWLLVVVGIVMYVASRRFAPEEEAALSEMFGARWDEYRADVMIPWL